jgi:hypothetical protein
LSNRRITRLLASSAAALSVVLGALGCGSASSSSSQTPSGAGGPHGEPEAIFEDELHLHSDPAGTIELMRQLGVQRIRVYVPWRSIAPAQTAAHPPAGFNGADPAAYPAANWTSYDAIVREAARRKVALDVTVGGPVPTWAEGAGAPGTRFASWMPNSAAFGAFVRAVGTRYGGHYTPPGAPSPLPRASFWSIWNEPNYGPGLAPQATQHSTVEVSPRLYRSLLDAAWTSLKGTGHGQDTILIGETAPRGQTTGDAPGNFQGMVPLRFVRALYCVDADFHPLTGSPATARGCPSTSSASAAFAQQHPALFRASGFADHPYPQGGNPPNVRTPDEPDYADLAAIGNLESTLDRAMGAYGVHTQLPIYSTEFGYQTNPPEKIAHTTDPVTAALFLNWAEYLTWRNPRLRSYDQYLLTDPPTANANGGFATGLEFSNGIKKATYDAFRLPLFLPQATVSHGEGTEVWGCVRPAVYPLRASGEVPPVRIEFAKSGTAFTTVKSLPVHDPHGYIDTQMVFPSTGTVRLAWTPQGGQTIYSRPARVVVH